MTDQRKTTTNPNAGSHDQASAQQDEVVPREAYPVPTRERRLARLFAFVVCVAIVVMTGWLLFKGALLPPSPQPVGDLPLFSSQRIPMPERLSAAVATQEMVMRSEGAKQEPSAGVAAASLSVTAQGSEAVGTSSAAEIIKAAVPSYDIVIGPFITKTRHLEGEKYLKELGLLALSDEGTGPVKLIRLREGVYAPATARQRLAAMKRAGFESSFVLPAGEKLAVYAGSFVDQDRAIILTKELESQNIKVTWVDAELTKKGILLKLKDITETVSLELEQHFRNTGVHVHKSVVE